MKLFEIMQSPSGYGSNHFKNLEFEKLAILVKEKLTKKYGRANATGRNRLVFYSKNFVIKVPKNEDGLNDNTTEARSYQLSKKYKNPELAPARLIHLYDLPVIVMSKLNTDVPIKDLPDWASFYDTFQVGLDRKGRFKAYDYA